jgi:hypothetical protein
MTSEEKPISYILYQTLEKQSKDIQITDSNSYLNKSLSEVFGFDPQLSSLFSPTQTNNITKNSIQSDNSKSNKRKQKHDKEVSSLSESVEQPSTKRRKTEQTKTEQNEKVNLFSNINHLIKMQRLIS